MAEPMIISTVVVFFLFLVSSQRLLCMISPACRISLLLLLFSLLFATTIFYACAIQGLARAGSGFLRDFSFETCSLARFNFQPTFGFAGQSGGLEIECGAHTDRVRGPHSSRGDVVELRKWRRLNKTNERAAHVVLSEKEKNLLFPNSEFVPRDSVVSRRVESS